MKEFAALSAEAVFSVDQKGALRGTSTVVLMTSEEVCYRGDKMLHRERPSKLNQFLFVASRSGLRALIEGLQAAEAELKDLEERVTIEPKRTVEASGYVSGNQGWDGDEEAVGC